MPVTSTMLLFIILLVGVLLEEVNAHVPVQHLELRPTAALAEERRRRKLGIRKEEDLPTSWFHPYMNAVYATLSHHGGTNTSKDPAYQDFVQYRHLSRYERHMRTHIKWDLQPYWQGNYTTFTTSDHRNLEHLIGGQFNQYQGVPLSQGYGTHYVHLWVGSPTPQRQSVIVDTGSHFTAFPCK